MSGTPDLGVRKLGARQPAALPPTLRGRRVFAANMRSLRSIADGKVRSVRDWEVGYGPARSAIRRSRQSRELFPPDFKTKNLIVHPMGPLL